MTELYGKPGQPEPEVISTVRIMNLDEGPAVVVPTATPYYPAAGLSDPESDSSEESFHTPNEKPAAGKPPKLTLHTTNVQSIWGTHLQQLRPQTELLNLQTANFKPRFALSVSPSPVKTRPGDLPVEDRTQEEGSPEAQHIRSDWTLTTAALEGILWLSLLR